VRHLRTDRARRARWTALIPLAAVASGCAVSPSSSSESETECNRRIVAESFEQWRAGTGGPFDLLEPDAIWTITGRSRAAGEYPTKQAFIEGVIRPFNDRMSRGLSPVVRGLYADGDTVVVFFDGEALARDGEPYWNTYAWIMKMRHGRVIEVHAFFDAIEFDELWRRVPPNS